MGFKATMGIYDAGNNAPQCRTKLLRGRYILVCKGGCLPEQRFPPHHHLRHSFSTFAPREGRLCRMDPDNVMFMKRTADRLFGADYVWSVLGAGRYQMPVCTQAAMLGGNVRVGLEDSLFL